MKCPACGGDMAAKDFFCWACGTRRPRFVAAFENAASQYAELRAAYDAGHLDAAAYETALLRLTVRDDAGSYWAPGADSGEWHRFEGTEWVRRTPPLAGAAHDPDMPRGLSTVAPAPRSPATASTSPRARASSLLSGLSLILGWGAGWPAGYGLALAAGVLFLPSVQHCLNVTAAGTLSGVVTALITRPGANRASVPRALLAGAVWALTWAIGWFAAWAAGAYSAREFGDAFYSLALSLPSPWATAAVLWFHIYGLAGIVAGVVAGILATPVLGYPGRGCSPVARSALLIFWSGLWAVGWLGIGGLQASLAVAFQVPGDSMQSFSLLGGAIGGAVLCAALIRIFNRRAAMHTSTRVVPRENAHA